ncbi:acetoacetyl-CoA synthetase [Haematospirillum jordaniae]|uniref:Acetoacetyl-CoA synthetase n=1 Tax=Haematospirillum jordaniae TaxID=1549855 RepID=A0A143DCQ2_9PROT|nr:acetoacetyl-CoA synthetase [Haematospirillum jordaniae]
MECVTVSCYARSEQESRVSESPILWQPSDERIRASNLFSFMTRINDRYGVSLADYESLHRWSVENIPAFWQEVWAFCELIGDPGLVVVDDPSRLPGARWFPEGRVNYAENLLRPRPADTLAVVFRGEDKVQRRLTYGQLCEQVSRAKQALQAAGVVRGDRVAAYMPNMPETLILMLAAVSIGAVWSSASPDFGVQGVLDRFGQIEPVVLLAVDGYHYNGKSHDIRDKVRAVAQGIPSLRTVVVVPYVTDKPDISSVPKAVSWDKFLDSFVPGKLDFARLPFDHPLFVMFSSGTTGVPKCIVHSHGGTLLQQVKEHVLHCDEKAGDRVFYFTTCGWMMWNWLVSALAVKAALMLYDGAPSWPSGNAMFDYAQAERFTFFGTSAKWIDAIRKDGLRPRDTHDLSSVRVIASTGSPLVPESFDYVYDAIKPDVLLASISGGTDIVSCFMLGNPLGAVRRGEIMGRGLGLAVDVFDEAGKPIRGEKGELVCTKAFPAVPVGFWGDTDGAKFRSAYFERFPGIWTHGDWVELTGSGGIIVYGRSDATLNPSGVRIGTAEIYRQVEKLEEVVESLVVGQDWDNDTRVILFVRLRPGVSLDPALQDRIRKTIRENCTPRHVPARIVEVADIPRTKSGKIVELAVREVVHGRPVKNMEALANPEALAHFANRPELST